MSIRVAIRVAAFVALARILAGCGGNESAPAAPQADLVTVGAPNAAAFLPVIGSAGAVPGGARVIAVDTPGPSATRADSISQTTAGDCHRNGTHAKADGSFKLKVCGTAADVVSLQYVVGTKASRALTMSVPARMQCDAVHGPVQLTSASPELVYGWNQDGCGKSDYSDNPARPFIVNPGSNQQVLWLASNAQGYLKGVGAPAGTDGVEDLIAKMDRVKSSSGACETYLTGSNPANPLNSYYNFIWLTVPYTVDGQNVYGLIHNEFHDNGSIDDPNWYANVVGASSSDAGASFTTFAEAGAPPNTNTPVVASPYPYTTCPNSSVCPNNGNLGPVGMLNQSNIIKWNGYYYFLTDRYLAALNPALSNGVCIYRTANVSDFRSWLGWDGTGYTIPTVDSYPSNLSNPSQYVCATVLPEQTHLSWTYNTVLGEFIIMGVDTNFVNPAINGGNPVVAFVYATATIDPATGRLTPAQRSNGRTLIYYLQTVNWTVGNDGASGNPDNSSNSNGAAYPSILDPTSPTISDPSIADQAPEDLNFQYSDAGPYVYYTLLHATTGTNLDGADRDLVREQVTVTDCQ